MHLKLNFKITEKGFTKDGKKIIYINYTVMYYYMLYKKSYQII